MRTRAYAVLAVLIVAGLGCAIYVLSHQGGGVSSPLRDTYEVKAEVTTADGVSGKGQPVNVAGVEVGSVTDVDLAANGNALLTLQIERDQLPYVYADTSVALEPITPLKDMSIALDPGGATARRLPEGTTIWVARTSPPTDLSTLLSGLDSDTRSFLTTLLASFGQGTKGQGQNMRAMFRALGPATADVRRITAELAKRRGRLARLVHNIAIVTKAASRDRELAAVVQAGNRTLEAIGSQDEPLREALAKLPKTLRTTRQVLDQGAKFSDELRPAVSALTPPVRGLPPTLAALNPFLDTGTTTLRTQLRPLARVGQPVARDLGAGVPRLAALAPNMTSSLQSLNYFANDLAYNPPGDDEGYLFWLGWWAHNWNSLLSTGDAHGNLGRVMIAASCEAGNQVLQEIDYLVKLGLGFGSLCP